MFRWDHRLQIANTKTYREKRTEVHITHVCNDQIDSVFTDPEIRTFGMKKSERLKRPLLTGFLPISAAASIYLDYTAMRHRASSKFIGSSNYVPMAFVESISRAVTCTGELSVLIRVIPRGKRLNTPCLDYHTW